MLWAVSQLARLTRTAQAPRPRANRLIVPCPSFRRRGVASTLRIGGPILFLTRHTKTHRLDAGMGCGSIPIDIALLSPGRCGRGRKSALFRGPAARGDRAKGPV